MVAMVTESRGESTRAYRNGGICRITAFGIHSLIFSNYHPLPPVFAFSCFDWLVILSAALILFINCDVPGTLRPAVYMKHIYIFGSDYNHHLGQRTYLPSENVNPEVLDRIKRGRGRDRIQEKQR